MAFKEFLDEMYEPMGGVTVRSMFGGLGVFKDATMFGLAVDDVLYLRADDTSAQRYAAEKAAQFVYKGMKGREVAMPYFRLPDRLYDDRDEFLAWSVTAFDVAKRAAAAKAKRQKPAEKKAAAKSPALRTAPGRVVKKGRPAATRR